MELNGHQVWNNGEDWLLCMTHEQLEEVWMTAAKSCLPRKLPKWMTSRTHFKLGKTLNKDTGSALETSHPKTCDLLLSSPCALQILRERELTAQQHLFPDCAQMRAHIVTVINSCTCGLAPMMMGNLSGEDSNHYASSDEPVESEDGELHRLEIRNRNKVFTKSRHEPS